MVPPQFNQELVLMGIDNNLFVNGIKNVTHANPYAVLEQVVHKFMPTLPRKRESVFRIQAIEL